MAGEVKTAEAVQVAEKARTTTEVLVGKVLGEAEIQKVRGLVSGERPAHRSGWSGYWPH
ncbi:hypothetical protein GCM10009760_25810 [Kitasatospora kazusensis]|uniref:Uncharacterized protein n=1 Tax=Kitasatospora kazusensis TaxID=407974 RepID=A0ABN2ZFR0_9ACTN